MSVFFDNHGRESGYQADEPRPLAWKRLLSQTREVMSRNGAHRADVDRADVDRVDVDRAPLWGLTYDRVEGVVPLLLAFTLVGGAAAIMSSALYGTNVPAPGAAQEKQTQEKRMAAKAPKPVAAVAEPAPVAAVAAPAPVAAVAAPAPVAAVAALAPLEPETTVARSVANVERQAQAVEPPKPSDAAPALDPFLDAKPIAATAASAPAPLAPPPAQMREKLAARQEAPAAPAPQAAIEQPPAPPEPAQAMKEEASVVPEKLDEAAKSEESGRTAKCYFKLSGRVQNSGTCRVQHSGESVVFQFPGKPLEIAHNHGRVWVATLGGRNLGKVYKSGACWGAKGFYACENS
jgi:hypothetical protein